MSAKKKFVVASLLASGFMQIVPGRKGRQPWYLLTNEVVENGKQA
jgi:hypothetical protein